MSSVSEEAVSLAASDATIPARWARLTRYFTRPLGDVRHVEAFALPRCSFRASEADLSFRLCRLHRRQRHLLPGVCLPRLPSGHRCSPRAPAQSFSSSSSRGPQVISDPPALLPQPLYRCMTALNLLPTREVAVAWTPSSR